MININENTVAIVLGGGVGSRLYPLTKNRSKPAVPVAGKYRLIDIPISNCINSDLRRIFVLTQFNSASLNRHVKNTYSFDTFSNAFVDILAAQQTPEYQDWFQGTADAVRKVQNELKKIDYEYVLILSGDQLYQMDLDVFIHKHINEAADITIATIPVNSNDAPGFGIMKVDDTHEIKKFIEKPATDILSDWTSPVSQEMHAKDRHYLASMGIYAFRKSVLDDLLSNLSEAIDFGKEIIPYAVNHEDLKVMSYAFEGYWTDIGSISSFYEANLKLTQYLPEYHLYDNVKKLFSRSRSLAPTKFFGTRINHGLVSEGCICHADEIHNSVIGIRSRLGKGTVIKDSIIMGNDYYQTLDTMEQLPDNQLLGIGNNCYIQNTIMDKNVRIGHDVTIIGSSNLEQKETDQYCIKEGLIIIKKGAYIENGTQIGLDRPN